MSSIPHVEIGVNQWRVTVRFIASENPLRLALRQRKTTTAVDRRNSCINVVALFSGKCQAQKVHYRVRLVEDRKLSSNSESLYLAFHDPPRTSVTVAHQVDFPMG